VEGFGWNNAMGANDPYSSSVFWRDWRYEYFETVKGFR